MVHLFHSMGTVWGVAAATRSLYSENWIQTFGVSHVAYISTHFALHSSPVTVWAAVALFAAFSRGGRDWIVTDGGLDMRDVS
jgi:hypothetical protein